MSKNILIAIIVVVIIVIGIVVYYFSQGVRPGVPEKEVLQWPGERLSEEKLKEKYPDFVEGTIKIQTREIEGKPVERFILLTEDGKNYGLMPGDVVLHKKLYEKKGIKEGDKVEIQGRLEKFEARNLPPSLPPQFSVIEGRIDIGLITKK